MNVDDSLGGLTLNTNLQRGGFALVVASVMACSTAVVPIGDIDVDDSPMTRMLAATEQVELTGSIQLAPGSYDVSALIDGVETISIKFDTIVQFDIAVRLDDAIRTDGGWRLVPKVRRFALNSSKTIVIQAADLSPVHAAVVSADLSDADQTIDVGVRVGETLAATITGLVLNAFGRRPEQPPSFVDLVVRLDVESMQLLLRSGAVVEHAGSTLVVSQGRANLTNVRVALAASTASADIDARVTLGAGTRLVGGDATATFDQLQLDLHGSAGLDERGHRFSATTSTSARLAGTGGRVDVIGRNSGNRTSVGLRTVGIELVQHHCVGLACEGYARVHAVTSSGSMSLDDNVFEFESLELIGGRISTAPDPSASTAYGIRIDRVRLANPSVCVDCVDGRGTQLALSHLDVDGLEGGTFGGRFRTRGDVHAGPGKLVFTLSSGDVAVEFASGAHLVAAERQHELQLGGGGSASIELGADVEDLTVRSRGAALLTAKGVRIDATVAPGHTEATVRARDPAVVTALAQLGDVRAEFSTLRLERRGEAVRLRTEGLRITTAKEQLLGAIRDRLPERIENDPKSIDSELLKAVLRLSEGADALRLKHLRATSVVHDLDKAKLTLEGDNLRLQGDLRVHVKFIGRKTHIRSTICDKQVETKTPYPCWHDWHMSTCHKTVKATVPYPCIVTSNSDVEIDTLKVTVGVDATARVVANTPTYLDRIVFAFPLRCGAVNVRNVPDDLERLLKLRDKLCQAIEAIDETYAIGRFIDTGKTPVLGAVGVRRFDLGSSADQAFIDLDFTVDLGRWRSSRDACRQGDVAACNEVVTNAAARAFALECWQPDAPKKRFESPAAAQTAALRNMACKNQAGCIVGEFALFRQAGRACKDGASCIPAATRLIAAVDKCFAPD